MEDLEKQFKERYKKLNKAQKQAVDAIDGPVLHRDATNPNLVHLYIMSYERINLVGHFIIAMKTTSSP